MPSTSLEWALWLAERGFLIAPLPEGSKSAKGGAKWSEIYTTDAARIRNWFELAPKMNYLVCPGENYGIIDLDMGEDKDGIARFSELEAEHGAAPETFTVETWSGGQHIYYAVPEAVGNSASKIAPGIDVRGGGGYVVGPGSQVEGKFYTVLDASSVAAVPDWVFAEMSASRNKSADVDKPKFELDLPDNVQRAKDFLAKRPPAIDGDGGDEHTYVTFCRVRELGISKDMAMELVMEPGGWNERCEPPWEGSEMAIKADNAYNFAKDQQGSKGGVMELYEPDDMVDVTDLVMPDAPEEDREDFSQYILQGDGLWAANTHVKQVIPEWIPAEGYTCILARRGVGKTTLMIDMASCISTDMEWHGWPVLTDYYSIYFCGEHDTVALQMLRAWRDHNLGMDVASNERFIFIKHGGDLLDDDMTNQWAKLLRERIGPEGKAVVFVDTWQRATSGSSQNDDADMQTAVRNADRIAKSLSGPMVIAMHPPKAEDASADPMGSSVIGNSSVAIMTLANADSGKKLEVTRMKGRGEGNYMDIEFEIIDLGEKDEHGRDVTGQAVTKTGGTNPVPGEPDDIIPDSPTAESNEDKTERERQVLGKFMMLMREHVRSEDGKAKAHISKTDVAKEIIRIRGKLGKDLDEIELELREIGGPTLFEGNAKERKFDNMLKKCFIETQTSVSVESNGKHWDVGFEHAKNNSWLLKIKPTI